MWPAKGEQGYRTGNAPMPPMAPSWPLNPAAYQNMSNEQVDWARLAQQWIMMKDTVPIAPPPPQISMPRQPAPPGAVLEEEGGEAPMDISKDEDGHGGGGHEPWSNGNNWQQPPHPPSWNNRPGYWTHNKNEGGRFPPPPHPGPNFDHNRGDYFMCGVPGFGPPGFDGPPRGPPQLPPFVRPRQWEGKNMKIDRRIQNTSHSIPPVVEEEPAPVIDAAKRRTLPSWIREGLEKMEREKLKREEREKADLEREEANRRRLKEEQEALAELEAEKTGIPAKSKFDSDSDAESKEEDEEEDISLPVVEVQPRPRRRFHDGPPTEIKKPAWLEKPYISKEDLMLKVRRTMTEVLLEVTNSEIDLVVEETLRKALSKGLAMYGSGSDGSSSEEDDDVGPGRGGKGHDSGDDSDTTLKEVIRQRKQDFVVKEKEIEAAVAEAEERELRAASASQAKPGAESIVSAKDLGNASQAVRQVETKKEPSHADDSNGKSSSAKLEKTDRKQRSASRSSSSSSSSSDSSRSSRHRRRKKDKRVRNRSRDRKKDRKRRRSSSSSRRSRSPRRRDSSRDRERKRRDSRERSRSRNRRRRSRSSESHRKSHRRSRSRSDSSRRRRRRRSTSSSSSSDRRSRKRR